MNNKNINANGIFDIINDVFDGSSLIFDPYQNKKEFYITKKDKEYVLEMALPDYLKDELVISFDNGQLIVSYEIDSTLKGHKSIWRKPFKKVFDVSDDIDTSGIDASLKRGVLKITLPKKEKVKPKGITIN